MNTMKVLFTALICCLAFSISAQSHVGKWKMEVQSPEGAFVIAVELTADGAYHLDFGNDGSNEVTGKYSLSGDTMTINDTSGNSDCKGTGVYTVAVTATTFTMTRVSDECEQRGGPEGVMVATRM